MTLPAYTVHQVASICGGKVISTNPACQEVRELLIDSRRLIHPDFCLFIALVSERNNGHKYIGELYAKGVRIFMVSELPWDEENIEYRISNIEYRISNKAQPSSIQYPVSSIQHQASSIQPPASSIQYPVSSFILVPDTLAALQQLGAYHRRQFDIPVIGITGSNGKTIVKEWLFQMLNRECRIIRSPKSYNSQVGVPLSVWKMAPEHNLAIFEAGISMPGEMEKLEKIIQPVIGIFTNIGHAHDEHFSGQWQKTREKLRLFAHARTLIYCADYPMITECLLADAAYEHLQTFTWSRRTKADLQVVSTEKGAAETTIHTIYRDEPILFKIPFTDEASIENALHCICTLLHLNYPVSSIQHLVSTIVPIAMRLELKEAINHCSLINDSYNSDINSLSIALDFLNQQNQQRKKTVILSDILQTGREKAELYKEISKLLVSGNIDRIIGIGRDMTRHGHVFPMEGSFYSSTEDFLDHCPLSSFQNETILLKGARLFEFEKISQVLQQKAHETVMEVNIDAMVHNLNYFRSLLDPGTRTMAMVKAFSYGSGSYEIANVLQYYRVDYLAVAYADEGIELRKAGIHLPVMVMSPEEQSLDTLLKFNLEPEIYNLHILGLLEEVVARNVTSIQEEVRIHIKLDTGMHRLGFLDDDLEALIKRLKANPALRVQSVFSHLASSDDPADDEFTRLQISRFEMMSARITATLDYPVLRHILNSAGITRFPEAQYDMVRLGIGLYGVGSNPAEQAKLRNVSTLKSVITQLKHIPAGESIGYNRKGKADKDMWIGIVPIGYADGLNRRLGNGRGNLWINGKPAPIVGNICMDMTMIDVSGILDAGCGMLDEYCRRSSMIPDSSFPSQNSEPQSSIQYPASSIQYPPSSIQHPASSIAEGSEVIIFSDLHPVSELAEALDTIPYEVLTGISRRVKRIYYYE